MVLRAGQPELVLDRAGLERLLASPNGPVARHLARVAARVEGRAKELLSGELVDVQTGRLRSSTGWRFIQRNGVVGVAVGSGVEYAIFVHQGTSRGLVARPYLVRAVQDVLGPSVV